jgi:Carboxypeptidase regulatory-like domain
VNLTLTANHRKGEPVTAQTDDNGRFAFHDVAAGHYRLNGEKTGFGNQEYGARLNPNSGALLEVSAGDAVKDVTFKLVPNALIGGRVVDQDGEPMPNLLVAALHQGYVRGKRQWTQAGGAQTNDRGEFRIGNLRPGRYIVSAADMNIGIGLAGVSKDAMPATPETSYATTYSGNTTEMERAAPIEVRMGEDRRGADIQMLKTTTVRVRGKVVGAPDGKVMMVMLLRKNAGGAGNGPAGIGIVQPTDATFEIKNVAPGSYLLIA